MDGLLYFNILGEKVSNRISLSFSNRNDKDFYNKPPNTNMNMNSQTVTLMVKEDSTKTVKTTIKAAQQSVLLKGLFEEMESGFIEDNMSAIPIFGEEEDLEKLHETLKIAISFMELRAETPMNEIQKPLFMTLKECVGDQFFAIVGTLDYASLGRLLSLSFYLNIPDLTELIGARLAEMIQNITPQQLAEQLGVNYRDVISEEKEAAVRKQVEDSLAQYN